MTNVVSNEIEQGDQLKTLRCIVSNEIEQGAQLKTPSPDVKVDDIISFRRT